MLRIFLNLLRLVLFILIPISSLLLPYIYLYPLIRRCSFPDPTSPLRILVLADPQLEGNTQIYHRRFNASHPIIRTFRSYRKRLDIWGNDWYLAHIYRTLHDRSKFMLGVEPTHTTILGDLIGSQWIFDNEFQIRGRRYWDRVFKGSKTAFPVNGWEEGREVEHGSGGNEDEIKENRIFMDDKPEEWWKNRLINIVGNHDIGYAGEITADRMTRYERMYGRGNFVFFYNLPRRYLPDNWTGGGEEEEVPRVRFVVLNTLNIDGPAYDHPMQVRTYNFMQNSVYNPAEKVNLETTSTVLLTHVPMHKPRGVCVDPPMVRMYDHGTIREQNHITPERSRMLLNEIFGIGKPIVDKRALELEKSYRDSRVGGLILTGHDHEGCDVWHYYDEDMEKQGDDVAEEDRHMGEGWATEVYTPRSRMNNPKNVPPNNVAGVREITVRSMMGEFGGNAGLLSGWYDFGNKTWRFEYSVCPLGTQHWWWTGHIVGFITGLLIILYLSTIVLFPTHLSDPFTSTTKPSRSSSSKTTTEKSTDNDSDEPTTSTKTNNNNGTATTASIPKLVVTEVESLPSDNEIKKRRVKKGKRSDTLEREIMKDVVVVSASDTDGGVFSDVSDVSEGGTKRKKRRRRNKKKNEGMS